MNLFNTNLNISESNRFSYLTVSDTNKLLEYVYDLISVDDKFSTLLINAMQNTYFNSLNFDDKVFLHKYGYYERNYNEIGIYNSNNPYLISIFTLYGPNEEYMFNQTRNISKEIYEIYKTNLTLKEEYCKEQLKTWYQVWYQAFNYNYIINFWLRSVIFDISSIFIPFFNNHDNL